MNAESNTVEAPSSSPQIAALFDLDDEAERFMVGVMLRFHSEHPGLYTPIAIRRARNDKGERVTIELAKFQPQRRAAPAEWMLIAWNTDEVSIGFKGCPDMKTARSLFATL